VEIIQIVGIGIVATVLVLVLKNQRPELGILVSIITGLVIFFFAAAKLVGVIELLKDYARKVNIDSLYISTLLKVIGIAYIAEFGAEICKDAGESSIASKIELAGKIIIVVLAVPIITSLLELVIRILP